MSDIQYRLIFQEMGPNAEIAKVRRFFENNIRISNEMQENILNNPPRVLQEPVPRNEVKKIHLSLKKMGCMTTYEPILTNDAYPFYMPEKEYKVVRQELSKAYRSKISLPLFLIRVEAPSGYSNAPSMIGPFCKTLSERFRESDKVVGIDPEYVIVLGFTTSKEDVKGFMEKIKKTFAVLLDKKILFSIGYALFPEQGKNIPDLLQAAELKRKEDEKSFSSDTATSSVTPYVLSRDKGTLTPIQVCFTEARGKIFRRLLDMNPQTLLLGLSQLSQDKQREFLARLPFNSPLLPVLEDAMATQIQPTADQVAEDDLETIIYYMELDAGLSERKNNQDLILSKMNRIDSLPTLPSIATHVMMIASNPDASAQDLTDVIMNDPSLTSALLKIVNSAFYGFPQKIGTVKQAVVLLGTGEVVALAFGLSTAKLFAASHLKGVYSPKDLWRHSMCTGLIAENLCKGFPEYRKLGVFTAGLLHDFGKILLIDHFPELYGQVHVDVRKHELPLYDLEDEKFGLNHAVIGEYLASSWNLPEPLVQAISFHHHPAAASSYAQLAAIIGLADYLYYGVSELGDLEHELTSFPCELTSSHWTFLGQLFSGLNTEMLESMIQDALEVIKRSHELFSILE